MANPALPFLCGWLNEIPKNGPAREWYFIQDSKNPTKIFQFVQDPTRLQNSTISPSSVIDLTKAKRVTVSMIDPERFMIFLKDREWQLENVDSEFSRDEWVDGLTEWIHHFSNQGLIKGTKAKETLRETKDALKQKGTRMLGKFSTLTKQNSLGSSPKRDDEDVLSASQGQESYSLSLDPAFRKGSLEVPERRQPTKAAPPPPNHNHTNSDNSNNSSNSNTVTAAPFQSPRPLNAPKPPLPSKAPAPPPTRAPPSKIPSSSNLIQQNNKPALPTPNRPKPPPPNSPRPNGIPPNCPNCRVDLNNRSVSNFCPDCGFSFPTQPSPQPNTKQQNQIPTGLPHPTPPKHTPPSPQSQIPPQRNQYPPAPQRNIPPVTVNNNNPPANTVPSTPQKVGEIVYKELSFGKKLGEGAFGTVYVGNFRGSTVAIKSLKPMNEKDMLEFEKEIHFLRGLNCPYIVGFIGMCSDPKNRCIVTEYMGGGSLYDILHTKKQKLQMHMIKKLSIDIASGLDYLHRCKPPIIHRDVKSMNILVDSEECTVGKVCDFGLARVRDSIQSANMQMTQMVGSPMWMAPEIMKNEPYSQSVDVYSYALVMFEMFTNRLPYPELNQMQLLMEVAINRKRPQLPPNAPPFIQQLINNCWHPNPDSRPTFSIILQILDGKDQKQ